MRPAIETGAGGRRGRAFFEPRRAGCMEGRGPTAAAAVEDLRQAWCEAVDELLAEHKCDGLSADKAASVWERGLTTEQAVEEALEEEYARQLEENPDVHMRADHEQRAYARQLQRGA